jgi:serine O-acetyltransferase
MVLRRIYNMLCGRFDSKKWWKLRTKALNGNVIAKFRYNRMCEKEHAFIPLSAKFENTPVLPHGINGVFISQGAIIGSDAVIFHQVTIGSNNTKGSKSIGSPVIGNNVFIGCGAKIIGKVVVGNNVRIGANCVVCHDVTDNTTVVLSGIRQINHEGIIDNSFVPWGE